MVRQLFIPILLFSCLFTTTASEALMAKDNCQSSCGNINISYPFGIGKGCFVDEWFEVVSGSSTNPTAVLKRINLEVNRIDLYDGTLDVRFPIIFWNCGDEKTLQQNLSFKGSPFAFSENKNKFIAVGCEGHATISSEIDQIVAGCSSVCANNVSVDTRCNGVNCCMTSIPSKLQVFNARFNITSSSDQNSETDCRYAFLVKETWFSQSVPNLSALSDRTVVPVVLNWGLDASKHEDVGKSVESFSRKSGKSKSTGTGYCNKSSDTSFSSLFTESGQLVCYCKDGFEGNPYLPGGCDDIDKCQARVFNKRPCGEYAKCKNTVGSFKCKPKYKNLAVPLGIVSAVAAMLGSRESARVAKNMSNMMRKKKFFKRNGGQFLERQFISGEADVEETKLFEPEELEKATDNFKIDRVLGQGGQDTVYKGMLRDGNIVAVKKSKIVDESRVEEFINEVVNLSKVNHRNVVKLLGFCLKTEDPLLVYEDVPNGTLYQYIYDEQEEFPLTWEIRLRIATEIAGALTHLHSSATLSTYRRDITSKNILLDGKYGAKLADIGTSRSAAIDDQTDLTIAVQGVFDLADTGISISVAVDDETDLTTAVHDSSGLADIGASRSVPADDQTDLATAVQGTFDLADTGASRSVAVDDETDFTTAVHGPSGLADIGTSRSDATDEQTDLITAGHGTFGNLDPEESSQSTKMSDVYGFGVVLVELLIGQKLLSIQRSKQGRSLATFFMQAIEKNKLFNIVDARVKKEGKKASIIAFAKLAKRCLNSNAKKRPAMKEVAVVLEDIRQSEIKASDTHDEQPFEEGENGTWLPSLGDLTGSSSFVLP